jgi:hypothetical protein
MSHDDSIQSDGPGLWSWSWAWILGCHLAVRGRKHACACMHSYLAPCPTSLQEREAGASNNTIAQGRDPQLNLGRWDAGARISPHLSRVISTVRSSTTGQQPSQTPSCSHIHVPPVSRLRQHDTCASDAITTQCSY